MNHITCSDVELLAVLVGQDEATRLYKGSLMRVLQEVYAEDIKQERLAAAGELVRRALLEVMSYGPALGSPQAVRDYLRLLLCGKTHEVFVVLFLDAQNRVVAVEELFRGTLTQTSVYPREIVKQALSRNSAALIFAHNHPSGVAEPSRADETLTQTLKHALALVDVKVLDHFVIGGDAVMSFAERGLI